MAFTFTTAFSLYNGFLSLTLKKLIYDRIEKAPPFLKSVNNMYMNIQYNLIYKIKVGYRLTIK